MYLSSNGSAALPGAKVQVKVTEVSHVIGFKVLVALQAVL
jgi:hypothetical protein